MLTNPTYLISSQESIKYLENSGYAVYGQANGCGFLPYNRRPKTRGKKSWNDKSKFVGVSKHQAIIDLNLWIQVQNKLIGKAVTPHPSQSNFTFLSGGIVRCKCGGSMFVCPGRCKNDGTRIYYFRCLNKKNGSDCDNKFLRVDVAERKVIESLKNIPSMEELKLLANKKNKSANLEEELILLKKKISSNTKSIENLVNKLTILSNEASVYIAKKIEEFTNENISLKEDLLKLERKKLLKSYDDSNIEILFNQINLFLNTDDIDFRRICIKTIVKSIIWDSGTKDLKIELLI